MKEILYIAHRGLHNKLIPENSIVAINNALNNNKAIEIDVQLTKDSKLIVFHDKNLLRMTGFNNNVFNTTFKEIQSLKLKDTKEKIPLLHEILDIIQGKVILDIEIKHYKKWLKTVKITNETLKNYQGTYFIKSFNPLIPFLYKILNPNVPCGILVGNYPKKIPHILKKIFQDMKYLWIYKPDFICYNIKEINPKIIKKIKKKGIPLFLYTIKNVEDLKKAQKISQGIIYENLDL